MTTVTHIMTDLGWTFRAGEWRKPGKLISHTNTLHQLLAHAGEDAFRQFIGWIGVPVTQKEKPMPVNNLFTLWMASAEPGFRDHSGLTQPTDTIQFVRALAAANYDGWSEEPTKRAFVRHGIWYTYHDIGRTRSIREIRELVEGPGSVTTQLAAIMSDLGWSTDTAGVWQKGDLSIPLQLDGGLRVFGPDAIRKLVTDFENRQTRKDENRPLPETHAATRTPNPRATDQSRTHLILDSQTGRYAFTTGLSQAGELADEWATNTPDDLDIFYYVAQITHHVTAKSIRKFDIKPIQETP